MKVKVLENYFDLVLRKQIAEGEKLEVTNERGTELAEKKLVEIIEEDNEELIEINPENEEVEIKEVEKEPEIEVAKEPKKAKKGK